MKKKNKRPTILLPVFDGVIARNLLRTKTIEVLRAAGVRVVLLPPKGKAEYYEREFADGDSVIVEKEGIWKHSRMEFIITGLFLHSIPTHFMKIRQRDWYLPKGKYLTYVGASMLRLLGHVRLWHHLIRCIDSLIPTPPELVRVFTAWDPDIVFAPTMIPRDEIVLMRLARRSGKKTIGMVKSWDNLTSKAFLRFFPDRIIAHTDIVKQEAVSLYGYTKENIIVTGVPQYDIYADRSILLSREAFCSSMGIDPSSKIILYAPAGDWMNKYDKDIVEKLLDAIERGELGAATVLLRLHPAYTSRAETLAGRKHLVVERPGKHFSDIKKDSALKQFEFDEEEMKHLANSMYHASVLVNTASTLTIEAAVYDRPIISLAFDGDAKLPYWKSVARYYDREHMRQIVQSGGAPLVRSGDAFIALLKEYLADPTLHAEGRARIVEAQCTTLDGRAGERVARAILELLSRVP